MPSLSVLALAVVLAASDPVPAPTDVPGRFGEFRRQIDGLAEPRDAAIAADGTIFVVERSAHRVAVIDPSGRIVRRWGERGSAPGQLHSPSGIALDAEGHVYVADTANHRVLVFTPDGELVHLWDEVGIPELGLGKLRRPLGIAVHGKRVLVADTGNRRVLVFDRRGGLQSWFGGDDGTEGIELGRPTDVAALPGGFLAVSDAATHRVVLVDTDAGFRSAWGDRGAFPGLLADPSGVAWFEGRLYVADRENHRIQVFDGRGDVLYEWGLHAIRPREGEGHLHYPDAVALAPSGDFAVVCESFQDRIQMFGPATGDPALYAADPAVKSAASPHYGPSVGAAGDLFAIVEPESQTVLVFHRGRTAPVMLTRIGGYGDEPGRFVRAADVTLGPSRTLAVSDPVTRRVQTFRLDDLGDGPLRFDPALAHLLRSVDLSALLRHQAPADVDTRCAPGAVALDDGGRLFVADELLPRIVVLDGGVRISGVWGDDAAGDGALRNPVDLAVGPDGRLYVADADRGEVVVFDREGRLVDAWSGGAAAPLVHPAGITVDDLVYVTDAATHRVRAFAPDGAARRSWGGLGLGAGELFKPRGVATASDGRLIVLDHGNHRGQVFDRGGAFLSAFGARLYVQPTRRVSSESDQ